MYSKTLRSSFLHALSGLILTAGLPVAASAVDFPAASPGAVLKQRVGLTDVEINYFRPSVKGRSIFGGLVPHGKVWRTGANSATTISFSTDVKFGGSDVPAGKYALYTIPGESEWTVILSKKTDLWGSFGYKESDDFVRVSAKPRTLPSPVETFTIGLNDLRDESATLHLTWDKVSVPVKLEVNFVEKLAADIEAAMAAPGDDKPYFQSAAFYLEHGKDLKKARAWVEKALEARPDAYWMLHVKAKILAKLGDKAGAIEAANLSIENATKNGDDSYVKSNKDLLASLK